MTAPNKQFKQHTGSVAADGSWSCKLRDTVVTAQTTPFIDGPDSKNKIPHSGRFAYEKRHVWIKKHGHSWEETKEHSFSKVIEIISICDTWTEVRDMLGLNDMIHF